MRSAKLVKQPASCFVNDPAEFAHLWQRLPVEIVHEILSLLANDSRRDALTLTLVSTSVRRVVLPILYYSAILRHPHQVPLFAAPFIPKRRLSLLAKPGSPGQRLLAHAPVHCLALSFSPKLPSLEQILAQAADAHAFDTVRSLALTAPLLNAHNFWLRKHLSIRPRTLMLFHHGCPQPVNFRAPHLSAVRTLYTSTLYGFGGSSPADLPVLRRIAITTRAYQPFEAMASLAAYIGTLLASAPHVESIVLCIGTRSGFWYQETEPWHQALAPLRRDTRFVYLPFARQPRLEWADICAGIEPPPIFRLSQVAVRDHGIMHDAADAIAREEAEFKPWVSSKEWDLDVHVAPWYVHGKSGVDYPGTQAPSMW